MSTAKDLILAIDQGTTGSTVVLMDTQLNLVAQADEEFAQHFPEPGWVEHDPEQIWTSVVNSLKKALDQACAKIGEYRIAGIGITNQRETICFWEKGTARPLARAIVWQDRRTVDFCEQLKAKGMEPFFQERTGLLLDPYFSGTKVSWAIKNWDDVKRAYQSEKLSVGTIDSFIVAKLTGGVSHVTEPSNASRTLAFNIKKKEWDSELCSALGISTKIWPEVRSSNQTMGYTAGVPGLADGIPIAGVLGDQQSALLGQACIKEGQAKCTYGTGAFLLVNTGAKPITSRHRLLTTIAWDMQNSSGVSETAYALEGSAFIAGAAVQWLRDGLGFFQSSAEIETLAKQVPQSDGVVFVPTLTGFGAPYWNPKATGMITGLTRGTTRAHLARAVLEGIAFQNVDILEAMQKDMQKPLGSLGVDGGASANDTLMQFQADVLGVELKRPKYLETTSLGAVFAAGLGLRVWNGLGDVEKSWQMDRRFKPEITAGDREKTMKRWKDAVARVNL